MSLIKLRTTRQLWCVVVTVLRVPNTSRSNCTAWARQGAKRNKERGVRSLVVLAHWLFYSKSSLCWLKIAWPWHSHRITPLSFLQADFNFYFCYFNYFSSKRHVLTVCKCGKWHSFVSSIILGRKYMLTDEVLLLGLLFLSLKVWAESAWSWF